MARRTLLNVVVSAALVGSVAATAPAQTNPSNTTPVAPQVQPTAPPPPAAVALPPTYGPAYAGYYESAGGFPYRQVEPVAQAVERVAVTRALYRQAQLSVDNAFRTLRRDFERSEQFLTAAAEERQAFDAYAAARDAAIRHLEDNVDYRALIELRQRLSDQLDDRRRQKHVYFADLVPLAQERMRYNQLISAMEAEAIRADPEVDRARRRYVTAGTALVRTRGDFKDSLRSHPTVVTALQARQQANVATIAAEAGLQGAAIVRDDALRFAYWQNRYSFTRQDNGYVATTPVGYYGYGSPYWTTGNVRY